MKTLSKITDKYSSIEHNEDNFSVGGGLHGDKFASNRHEEALADKGKLTLGKAVQMFKKATGLDTDTVRAVLKYAVPNMEWHHAGKLPKQYGGGMKKTFFMNSDEICNVAQNWDDYLQKFNISQAAKKEAAEKKRNQESEKLAFLKKYADRVERTLNPPKWFYVTNIEMQGKYGWFDSSGKSYKLPEYFSGWKFRTEKKYKQFLRLT